MNIKISNWWILWLLVFIGVTSAFDYYLVKGFQCNIPLGKLTLYLGRNIVELIAGVMGIAIGYMMGIKRKKKEEKK